MFHEHRPHIVLSMSTRQLTVAIALSGKGGGFISCQKPEKRNGLGERIPKKKLLVSADVLVHSLLHLMNS